MPNLALIEHAAKESSYHPNHIRYLVRKGLIKGEKYGGIWLIDVDSLKAYEAAMKAEGTQKHTPGKYREQDEG